jgi:DNA-binding NarL/FixJ family response regulator
MEIIHILIADDHTLFRDGLCVLLDSLADFEAWAKQLPAPKRLPRPRRYSPTSS